jgi:Cu/Zn superoxide dismutase
VKHTTRVVNTVAAGLIVGGGALLSPLGDMGASSAPFVGAVASTTLVNQAGAPVGTINFQQVSAGRVRVRAAVTGLVPADDFHGFHIHTNGACTGDFVASAGGHWNPGGTTHGDHAGDMPVLHADSTGVARASFTTDEYTVDQLLADPGGVAVIVHGGRDNYANIPDRYTSDSTTPGADATTKATGDAGARYACGVIGGGATPMGSQGGAGGFWSVASDGGVFPRGDAGFFGSEGATSLNKPIVGMAATPSRAGYVLAAADGGAFTHGDAAFAGSLGSTPLNQPVVGIALPPSHLKAVLHDQAGNRAGHVTFTQIGGRVRATAVVTGLTPASAFHGFHIHANGDCTGDFVASAGGHWNPGGTTHGDHGGDMPSVFADETGTARATSYLDSFTVAQLLADPGGVAVIVHAGRDNVANIPDRYTSDGTTPGADATTKATGDAGGRYACGVVGPTGGTTGPGYWMGARDGGVFALGDAPFLGSMGGTPLNAAVVGIASTPTGDGYWLAGRDGGVFAYGDAGFFGSMGGTPLNAPIVAIVPTPTGKGYWLIASDGGVFAFGDATFQGAAASASASLDIVVPRPPIVGAATTEGGSGYWLLGVNGSAPPYGDAEVADPGPQQLNAPIVGGA